MEKRHAAAIPGYLCLVQQESQPFTPPNLTTYLNWELTKTSDVQISENASDAIKDYGPNPRGSSLGVWRENLGIRRPGLSSCVTLSSSLYSLGCFLLSRARGLMCLILEASHEFRLLWILWRNLSLKYQLLVQSSQAGIDQFTVTHKLPPVIVVREMDPRVRNFIFSFS